MRIAFHFRCYYVFNYTDLRYGEFCRDHGDLLVHFTVQSYRNSQKNVVLFFKIKGFWS
jgi:hypothetical protein